MRIKIEINGNIVKQFDKFRYLEDEILYQGEVDVCSKIGKFLGVTRLINRTLRSKGAEGIQTEGVQHAHSTNDNIHRYKTWALKKSDKRRIEMAD